MPKKPNGKLLRIGMVQMDCIIGDVDANIKKTIDFVNEHRGAVDMLVFPELSLTGYSVGKHFHKYALRLDSPRFKKLIKHTQDITIGVGFIEETPSFNFFNSFSFIRNGRIIHTHRKIYLPNYDIFEEKKYFSVGSKFSCLNHDSFRIGPFICGDAWNPALVHLAAADEANLLIFSACSPEHSIGNRLSNQKNWRQLIRFYATMYGSYVVFVNRTGTERGLHFYGKSTLINPFGKIVTASKGSEEEVIVGTVNLDTVRKSRTILNTIRDENFGFIQKELQRIINNKDYL